jgi:nucleotide sugar dehydrogenase
VAEATATGRLRVSHERDACREAEAVLVCVDTDRVGLTPRYDLLRETLSDVAVALRSRPVATRPLVIIESALAPSTLQTIVRPFLAELGLTDGRDVLLAQSPPRSVRGEPGEGAARSERIVGGLHPEAPVEAASMYRWLTPGQRIHVTNGMTAEVVKAIETSFRDVRVAFASEVVRYCDRIDVDFFTLRDRVNDVLGQPDDASWNGSLVPTGAMLVPTVGVGGWGLPNAGVLLWWRALEARLPSRNSLVLAARAVNDASPAATVRLARMELGALNQRPLAVLGAAYRPDAQETRSSPSLVLATLLRDSGASVTLHDPHVAPDDVNVRRLGLREHLRDDLEEALSDRAAVLLATAHSQYRGELLPRLLDSTGITGVIDACNLFRAADFAGRDIAYAGIGRGRRAPDGALVRSVVSMYRAIARGVANELEAVVAFLNSRYAEDQFNRVDLDEVLRLAARSETGCPLEQPGPVEPIESHDGFVSGLAQLAADSSPTRRHRVMPERVPAGLWFGNEDASVPERDTPWPLTPLQ